MLKGVLPPTGYESGKRMILLVAAAAIARAHADDESVIGNTSHADTGMNRNERDDRRLQMKDAGRESRRHTRRAESDLADTMMIISC